MDIQIKPIGTVSSPVTERSDKDWGSVISRVVLREDLKGALQGLEDFSHAIILTHLHEATFDHQKHLKRRPRNLNTMPLLGIFSQRGKNRPNPIGVTTVEVVAVTEAYLEVKGLDAIDGTPVLDIKPYFPCYDRVDNPKNPKWVEQLMKDYF